MAQTTLFQILVLILYCIYQSEALAVAAVSAVAGSITAGVNVGNLAFGSSKDASIKIEIRNYLCADLDFGATTSGFYLNKGEAVRWPADIAKGTRDFGGQFQEDCSVFCSDVTEGLIQFDIEGSSYALNIYFKVQDWGDNSFGVFPDDKSKAPSSYFEMRVLGDKPQMVFTGTVYKATDGLHELWWTRKNLYVEASLGNSDHASMTIQIEPKTAKGNCEGNVWFYPDCKPECTNTGNQDIGDIFKISGVCYKVLNKCSSCFDSPSSSNDLEVVLCPDGEGYEKYSAITIAEHSDVMDPFENGDDGLGMDVMVLMAALCGFGVTLIGYICCCIKKINYIK